jgi:membrane protease YdiL (CAAX protease family)
MNGPFVRLRRVLASHFPPEAKHAEFAVDSYRHPTPIDHKYSRTGLYGRYMSPGVIDRPQMPRHKARDVVVAIIAALGVPNLIALLFHAEGWHLAQPASIFVTDVPGAVAVSVLVTRWRSWDRFGWRPPLSRSVWLLWLPAVLFVTSAASGKPDQTAPGHVIVSAIAVLLVGFTEEMWFRGVLLTSLMPRGPWLAVVVSSALFGAFHLLGFGAFGIRSVATQAIQAFAIGLMFAAGRVRTASLWPLIVLHAGFDFVGFLHKNINPAPISRTAVPSLLALVAVSLVYALVLARPSKVPEAVTAPT